MKIFFRNIHLYLSLAAGLVIMISCLSGAILVFEEELNHAMYAQRYFVKPETQRLPISQLVKNAVASVPKAKLASVKVYSDASRTVEIGLMAPEKKSEGSEGRTDADKASKAQAEHTMSAGEKEKSGNAEGREKGKEGSEGKKMQKGGGGKPNLTAYVNPYTGQVTELFNRQKSFFFTVEMLHRWLLSGKEGIGKTIVGVSTFFFLFILITGLILWWPKTKAILSQRLKIKWQAGWKRFNHDMHMVTGFYTSLFLIIIVMTGLVMSFNWINKGIFTLTGSKMENPEPPVSIYQAGAKPISIDAIYQQISVKQKAVDFYNIRTPKDSAGVFSVSVLPVNAMESAMDTYYIDQYSGNISGSLTFSDKNLGQQIRAYVKPIHTGAVYGLPTKIISFIICLLTFTFPITGVIMWLNRIKKGKKKAPGKKQMV